MVSRAAVAGDEQYDVAGGGVFRASNGNGDATHFWATEWAGRGLRARVSTTAQARDQMGHRTAAGDERVRRRVRAPNELGARGHREECAWARWVPRSTRNMMPCSGEHDGEHGHGGKAIRGDVLTATATR